MDPKNVTRHYSNGEVTIVWESGKCIHSGNCVRGLSKVFKPGQSPWIDPMGATSQEIIDQVQKCPSGALTILETK